MKLILRVMGILVLVFVGVIIFDPTEPQHQSETNQAPEYEYYYNENEDEEDSLLPEDLNSILADRPTVPLDIIPSSKTVLVNRKYLLPASYVPANLVEPKVRFNFSYSSDKRKLRKVAADALERLFAAGEKENVILYGISGYRSYARQKQIYDRNVATRGVEATNAVSAKPGSSEHQTGLTIDVSAQSVAYRLDQSFGDTKEGKWLAKHAHLYGYIIRYPYGKAKVTGYSYEPWHIRFVGKTVATYLYENNLTMEEYYGVDGRVPEEENKTPENRVDVEDPDTVTYATPKPEKKKKKTKKESDANKSSEKKSTNKEDKGLQQNPSEEESKKSGDGIRATAAPQRTVAPVQQESEQKPVVTEKPVEQPTQAPQEKPEQHTPAPDGEGSNSQDNTQ